MLIGIDVSPISGKSNHKVRGVGKYINLLKDNIEKYDKNNTYKFIEHLENLESLDLLHIPYFDPFFLNLPFRKKVKTVVTIHDLIPIEHSKQFPRGIKGNIKWQINKMLISKVDGIIVDSNASADSVSKILNFRKNNIHTVYLACDKELRPIEKDSARKITKKFNLPDSFFLYVGDLTWNKNLPRLVEASIQIKMPLVMVGKALSEEGFDSTNPWNKDRQIVNRLTRNNENFIKLGFVTTDELAALYSLALALCMPSIDEGFGLPVLEAMQCGCPVITTKRGSLPEVAGEAAEYVDAFDMQSIAHGMSKIAADKDLQNDLRKKGLSQSGKFTIQKMMEQTINVYNNK